MVYANDMILDITVRCLSLCEWISSLIIGRFWGSESALRQFEAWTGIKQAPWILPSLYSIGFHPDTQAANYKVRLL